MLRSFLCLSYQLEPLFHLIFFICLSHLWYRCYGTDVVVQMIFSCLSHLVQMLWYRCCGTDASHLVHDGENTQMW